MTRTSAGAIATARSLLRAGAGSRPTVRQAAVTALWLVGMLWTTSVRTGTWETPDTALLLSVLGAWAPLLVRTYRPVVAVLGTLVAEASILVFLNVPDQIAQMNAGMGVYQPAPLASMLAVTTLAARLPRRAGWLVGLLGGLWLGGIGLAVNTSETFLTDLLMFYLVVTAAATGVWWSGRRERATRERAAEEERTQQAVLDERLRIARELHDVLAHNLTLVNAQAAVAKYLMRSDLEAADAALGDIATHTGRAIDELRATIGLLRRRDDPEDGSELGLRPVPGLGALDELVRGFQSAGTDVDVQHTGIPVPLDQHVDLAAYRIIQESVTNASKHAPARPVAVTLSWSPGEVRIRVINPLSTDPSRVLAPGTHHGVIGMRERAAAAGGTFRAGAAPGGDSFEVVATLPTPTSRRQRSRPSVTMTSSEPSDAPRHPSPR